MLKALIAYGALVVVIHNAANGNNIADPIFQSPLIRLQFSLSDVIALWSETDIR